MDLELLRPLVRPVTVIELRLKVASGGAWLIQTLSGPDLWRQGHANDFLKQFQKAGFIEVYPEPRLSKYDDQLAAQIYAREHSEPEADELLSEVFGELRPVLYETTFRITEQGRAALRSAN